MRRILGLEPHPEEGGFFRETYRSDTEIPGTGRSVSTAIYYLLTADTFSAMHRLPGEEIFHFYLGDPVEMLQLSPDGTNRIVTIGNKIDEGMEPQVVVPGGTWQGSRVVPGGSFALLGATMAPGFDYADYEAGGRAALIRDHPDHAERITALTNEP
ncbi:MAG: cupin domain-containing protein [Acidobacteria bacterium]|nr:cupin domain-containing protein [Acidobacteriota bacterium]NIM62437.1 cupin domain-containing protein [Acidobacteriota bacterium]NIO59868.1 cupin domain-containing protein [Acidobacteriota bacterium]NIQ30950.1 cupin domain-containing protein [Acidobacteriota bacterium]NIQ86031.1 cupin domain-containing protein [Acidobacteriota bacterium]